MRKSALAIPICLIASSLLPRPADAISIELNSQFTFPLLNAEYNPDARRLVATSKIGNIQCGSGSEAVPLGTYSLRLDGQDYRLTPNSSQEVFRYEAGSAIFRGRLTALDELIGTATCESSNVSGADLRLQLNSELPQRIGQGVVYRTGSPRRLEVRVIDPLICFDFGGSTGNLRLDLTDANDELWDIQGVTLAQYAHSTGLMRVELPPSVSCFGFDGGVPDTSGGAGLSESLYVSGFEIEEIYPDLVITTTELPSGLENVFRYRIEVVNIAPGVAENVRVRDYYPKTGIPRFVDALENWTCSAVGTGASCGSAVAGGGRVDLVNAQLPLHLPGQGAPPRLVIEVTRTFAEYQLGQSFAVHAAATIAPPAFPDKDRTSNSSSLQTVVSEPAGPVAEDDLFSTDQDTSVTGNVFLDNGSGPDIHLTGQNFDVVAINGSPAGVGTPVQLRAAPPWGGTPATVTVQANGALSFNPGDAFVPVAGGETDMASFTYTIQDPDTLTSTATVTIEVAGFNDPPVAGDITIPLPVTGGSVATPGVLGSSFDPDDDALIVGLVNGSVFADGGFIPLPSGASLFMWSDGRFSYGWGGAVVGGSDSFDITISDGEFTGVARVTINFVAP